LAEGIVNDRELRATHFRASQRLPDESIARAVIHAHGPSKFPNARSTRPNAIRLHAHRILHEDFRHGMSIAHLFAVAVIALAELRDQVAFLERA
jgi:hypothetical protein